MNDGTILTWADKDSVAPGLLASLWLYRRQSVVIVMVFAMFGLALALAVNRLETRRPSATARLVLTDPRGNSVFRQGNSANTDLEKYGASRAEVATSVRVLKNASGRLGQNLDLPTLSRSVSSSFSADSVSIFITASASTEGRAVRIADAVAAAYQDVTTEDVTAEASRALKVLEENRARVRSNLGSASGGVLLDPAEREAATQALTQIELKANDITLNAALFGGGVDFVDGAIAVPAASTSPPRYVIAGTILGLLVAVVVAWIQAGWRRTVDENEHVSSFLGVPLLGEIPHLSGRALREFVRSPAAMPAAAFDTVIAGLAARRRTGGIVLTTGVVPGDGSTVTATSIAIGLAREGRNVVLVDADAGGHGAQHLLGASAGPGLYELARGLELDSRAVQSIDLGRGAKLSFVAPGRSREDLPSIYRSDGAKRALAKLALDYDLVIVDAPPLLTSPETASLVLHTNAVLIVVRRGTLVRTLESFRSRLAVYHVPVVGIVFNGSDDAPTKGAATGPDRAAGDDGAQKPRVPRAATSQPI